MKRFIWINTKWIMLPDSRIWPLCISSQFLESVYFLVVKIGIFDRLPVKWWSYWMVCSAEPCTDWWTKLFSWSVWLALECQQIMFSCIKQKKKMDTLLLKTNLLKNCSPVVSTSMEVSVAGTRSFLSQNTVSTPILLIHLICSSNPCIQLLCSWIFLLPLAQLIKTSWLKDSLL